MKKDLPNIYKSPVSKNNTHNKDVFYVKDDDSLSNRNQEGTVEEKLSKLFKSSRYIFNIGVIIRTAKGDYDTKIAGKVKNSIVTVDGDTIPIIEIYDLIIKDRL